MAHYRRCGSCGNLVLRTAADCVVCWHSAGVRARLEAEP